MGDRGYTIPRRYEVSIFSAILYIHTPLSLNPVGKDDIANI